MDPQPRWVHDGVVRRPGLLGGTPGDLISPPVLRSAVQSQEADLGPQNALLPDSRHSQELGQVHLLRFARDRWSCSRHPLRAWERAGGGSLILCLAASRGAEPLRGGPRATNWGFVSGGSFGCAVTRDVGYLAREGVPVRYQS